MPGKATIEEGTPAAAAADAVNKEASQKRRKIIIISAIVGAVLVVALILGLVFGLRSANASTASAASNLLECVPNDKYDANVDYFPEKLDLYVPNPNFQVKYFKNYKVITNTLQSKPETIVLYQCGTPKPDGAALNATRVIQVPIKSISAGDTTSITYLELLGVRNTIKYTDSLEYITSPCIQAAEAAKLGPQNLNTSATSDFSALNTADVALDYLDSISAKANNYVTFPATIDTSGYGVCD
ncbi:hypothetical protein BJ742DRAFT_80342 [Cladochytrium replicatum]|nr:hypothetical protein BJ742DRAFT_80342 [Cladochytrium replicatum]